MASQNQENMNSQTCFINFPPRNNLSRLRAVGNRLTLWPTHGKKSLVSRSLASSIFNVFQIWYQKKVSDLVLKIFLKKSYQHHFQPNIKLTAAAELLFINLISLVLKLYQLMKKNSNKSSRTQFNLNFKGSLHCWFITVLHNFKHLKVQCTMVLLY